MSKKTHTILLHSLKQPKSKIKSHLEEASKYSATRSEEEKRQKNTELHPKSWKFPSGALPEE